MTISGSCATTNPSAAWERNGSARGEDHRDDRVGECFGPAGSPEHAIREGVHLAVEGGREQGIAAGEAAVDGGPGAAGLAGDVVEGGLGDADPGDAGQGRIEDPVRLRVRFRRHH